MKMYLLLSVFCLIGCQSASMDSQKDMQETIDMTFCDAGGLKSFSPVANHGRLISFTCNSGLTGTLPTQPFFESDEDYLNKYYEQFLMLKLERCSKIGDDVTMFSVHNSSSKLRYHMTCKLSGRFAVDVGYFDNLDNQSEAIAMLGSFCETESFSLTSITNHSPLKKTYKFKCGQAKYTIDNTITPDDIHALNALYCDYNGFKSLVVKQSNSISNTKQASFSCRGGFTTTVKF